VDILNEQGISNVMIQENSQQNRQHLDYLLSLTGATSNLSVRQKRYDALKIELLG
jgi:hypothetical protein